MPAKNNKRIRYVLVVFMQIENFEIHHSGEMICSLVLIVVPCANELEAHRLEQI